MSNWLALSLTLFLLADADVPRVNSLRPPASQEGFHVTVGKPLETEQLDRAVATHGPAVNTGDNVQITRLEFRDHQIIVDVNGGGRGKRHWRDHIQVGMGGGYPTMQPASRQDQ